MTGVLRSDSVRRLIDFEDREPQLVSERLPDSSVPLWIQVRMQFATLLTQDELGDSSVTTPTRRFDLLGRLARSVLPDRTDATRWRGQRDLLFVVGGTTVHEREGRSRNWLIGDYAEAFPKGSLIVQHRPLASPLGPPAFESTRSLDPAWARAEFRLALRLERSSPSEGRVRQLVAAFATALGVEQDERLPAIADAAVRAETLRPHFVRGYERMLDQVNPRVLVMEDASYGGHYASLVALAQSRGITVAEPQHGWIGPAHAAYNYGSAMHRPENAVSLPGTLLTFGPYWGEGLSHPADIVPIGKPHIEERATSAPTLASRPLQVLVVSSVAGAAETSEFVKALRSALPPEWLIRFRPHPSERSSLETRYPGLFDIEGILPDTLLDAYDSLAATRVVVGVASTVLFEARAFGCEVIVRKSPQTPYYVGNRFGDPFDGAANASAVADKVVRSYRAAGSEQAIDRELWAEDPVRRFAAWYAALT